MQVNANNNSSSSSSNKSSLRIDRVHVRLGLNALDTRRWVERCLDLAAVNGPFGHAIIPNKVRRLRARGHSNELKPWWC